MGSVPGNTQTAGAHPGRWMARPGSMASYSQRDCSQISQPLDPLWQIEQAEEPNMLLRHQADGRLALWWVSCGRPSETLELPQVPDLNWKVRGWANINDLPFF